MDGLWPADGSQLTAADPALWAVAPGWQGLTNDFFASDTGMSLRAFLNQRLRDGAMIFPPQPLRALALTPPDRVRVVILGQDPYHGWGQAEGLAFSVAPGVALPPSLRNIFKEIQRDLGLPAPDFPVPGGSLVKWAENGVLLLNTSLTVEECQPASHAKRGWEQLTDAVISHVSSHQQDVIFMLWGARAQSKRELINENRHKILLANHPSPLSAMRQPLPFTGCGHFSVAQAWLKAHSDPGHTPWPLATGHKNMA